MFQQMYDGADDDAVKVTAERRLQQLQALDELDAINAKLADSSRRSGRCVTSLKEILPALQGVKLPAGDFRIDRADRLVDPTDVPYVLDSGACTASLDLTRTGVTPP